MSNKNDISQKEAVLSGVEEGVIEAIKLVPGFNILIGGIKKYEAHIENQQRELFLVALTNRIADIEQHFQNDWYKTPEAEEFVKKTVASALNAEYADKIDFFANMLINSKEDLKQMERMKFLELVRQLSKPALVVLDVATKLYKRRGTGHSPQMDDPTTKRYIITETGFEQLLVDACVSELLSLGVFSSEGFRPSVSGYTSFTLKFFNFISDPSE